MHGRHNPLTAEQLQIILADFLSLVLSEQRTIVTSAIALADCSRQQQEWVLAWLRTLVRDHVELGYQFVSHAPQAFALLDNNSLEEWVAEALEIYDRNGLAAATAHLQAVASYVQTHQHQERSLPLAEVQGVLEKFLIGLAGRQLKVVSSAVTYTDTETLFLPPSLNRFIHRENNFFLYKAMVTHLWAQTWFGTWRHPLSVIMAQFNHRDKALRLFHTLERLRLDACIARELPGSYRDMQHLLTLFSEQNIPTGWEDMAQQLAQPVAGVEDSHRLLETVYSWSVPLPVCYQGILLPEQVEANIASRQVRDKKSLQAGLAQLARSQVATTELPVQTSSPSQQIKKEDHVEPSQTGSLPNSIPTTSIQNEVVASPHFSVTIPSNSTATQSITPTLRLNGQPVALSTHLKTVISSIIQDKGAIPDDYLQIPHSGKNLTTVAENQAMTSNREEQLRESVFLYPEWDYRRQKYYNNWCVLREVAVPLQSADFVTDTLQRYRGLLKRLRRIFEVLRTKEQRLKRQPFGEDIDLEALIKAYAEVHSGMEMDEHIFTKIHRIDRHIAVLFMVDMSGSTKGWINQAERESLILLCEILETLGDRYAIYGFSGRTRKHCDIYPVKRFDEAYTTVVRQRISGIAPQQYTRMGVTIRHLTQLFKPIEAKIKLLITLSDGKPDDEDDNYRGTYGIEDTRQALLEAKRAGIHPFCITIDTEAKTYLPRMYGAVNYIVIDKVSQLPLKVSDIYRKLTC